MFSESSTGHWAVLQLLCCQSKHRELSARLVSIEIQSRSSLDRSHFVARSRSRLRIFVCRVYKRYFLLILTTLRVCQATPRLYRSRCRQVKISVSGTTLIKKLNNHRPRQTTSQSFILSFFHSAPWKLRGNGSQHESASDSDSLAPRGGGGWTLLEVEQIWFPGSEFISFWDLKGGNRIWSDFPW